MGNNRKRNKSDPVLTKKSESSDRGKDRGPDTNDGEDTVSCKNNPLYEEQQLFLSSLTPQERDFYFSSITSNSITPERRADLWMEQAEIGEDLVNRYAWATPTIECLKIFRAFSPIVEIGSGSNAYWTNYMKETTGVDVVAYDMNIQEGGKILSNGLVGANAKKLKTKKLDNKVNSTTSDSFEISLKKGGPEVLKLPELRNHTLFLCYPDEEDASVSDSEKHEHIFNEQENRRSFSFGWRCLTEYEGTHVIHVGELAVLGDANLNMEQSPWGRSSSSEFQQRLASEFHCIAKIELPNWLHVRDSISVWKRSEICQMVFVGEDDEEDDEEEIMEYRHIPPEEMLPRSIMAPCMACILSPLPPCFEMTSPARKNLALKPNGKGTHKNGIFTGKKRSGTKSKVDLGAKNDRDDYHDHDHEDETETETEIQSKKTKRGRRRERQKRQKMASSCNTKRNENKNKEKKMRSEYFRLNGKLPPQS